VGVIIPEHEGQGRSLRICAMKAYATAQGTVR